MRGMLMGGEGKRGKRDNTEKDRRRKGRKEGDRRETRGGYEKKYKRGKIREEMTWNGGKEKKKRNYMKEEKEEGGKR